MIDLATLCTNLAARYAPGTLVTPSGASAVRAASATRPKAVTAFPAAYVAVDSGTVVANPGQWRHEFALDVVFLLSKRPGDPVRVDAQRQKWLPTLLAATEGKMKLGIGVQSGWELAKVIPTGWDFTEETLGAEEFDAIRVHFEATVFETVSLVP